VRLGGSIVMYLISKRILKKAGRTDGHAWVEENVDEFERWLGDQDYVVSDALSISDVAMHGALSCVRDFPVFDEVMSRPAMRSWFDRVQAAREEHRAVAPDA
jgi:glutathione S-transferase